MAIRAPRLDDVAAHAGVSTATVSRFLNNPEMVAEATAVRVRAAIQAVNYVPNFNAGTLAGNRSRLIAALVPDIAASIFNDTVEAMIEELASDGNSVVLALTGSDNRRLHAEIDMALARRVDAELVCLLDPENVLLCCTCSLCVVSQAGPVLAVDAVGAAAI